MISTSIPSQIKLPSVEAAKAELNRRRWAKDPVSWALERAKQVLWSRQRDILLSVAQHRRTAAASCHEIGKSRTAALVACWWIDTHKPGEAFVVTSAPTNAQVRAILWREMGRVHAQSKLDGRVNQTEWLITMQAGNEELVAFGRKPDEYDPAAFQGIHAPYVLVIFDEAAGIDKPLWEAADSLIANDTSKIMVVSNPDDPTTEFAKACTPGSGWNFIQIGAFDTPNLTGEPIPDWLSKRLIGKTYIEEQRRKWARNWTWTEDGRSCVPPPNDPQGQDTNPLWQSKILGLFPAQSQIGGLIPLQWIRNAQLRTLPPADPVQIGADIGAGGDASVSCLRRGPVARIISEDTNPDTMQTTGKLIRERAKYGATIVKVDTIGIGKGVVDRGRELAQPFVPINVGANPIDKEQFDSLRAELYWNLRTLFESGDIDIDPDDEDLAAELASIRYSHNSSAQVVIEAKKVAKARGVPSPNRAESLMLAYAPAGLNDMQVVTLAGA